MWLIESRRFKGTFCGVGEAEILGLGVRKSTPFNQTLRRNYLWEFGEDSDCFWRSVVSAKYRTTWGEWTFEMVEGNIGVVFGRELKLVCKSSLL